MVVVFTITGLALEKGESLMLSAIMKWQGDIECDGKTYTSDSKPVFNFKVGDDIPTMLLLPKGNSSLKIEDRQDNKGVVENTSNEVVITVKKYMTEKASRGFDFMAKWNNDNPMPLRTMVGIKTKETRGMVYMELHGDIIAEKTVYCVCCGRKLTNPVSQYFGIGPECGNHNYINPFNSDEELKEAVASYRKKLQEIKWEGWIIKSAITNEEALNAEK